MWYSLRQKHYRQLGWTWDTQVCPQKGFTYPKGVSTGGSEHMHNAIAARQAQQAHQGAGGGSRQQQAGSSSPRPNCWQC